MSSSPVAVRLQLRPGNIKEATIKQQIKNLNTKKTLLVNDIPTKIIKEFDLMIYLHLL